MQSPTTMFGVSFRQTPRRGQRRAFEHPQLLTGPNLIVKEPTGYGKTLIISGAYSIRQRNQLSNRLLVVVPSRTLNEQFIQSFSRYMAIADVQGSRIITDVGFSPQSECIRRHRQNTSQVFITTIQYLAQGGFDTVKRLFEQGLWMLAVDEYHHYGIERTWGQRLSMVPANFLLALSATPYRPNQDSPFGQPHVSISYRDGVDEGVLKPLTGHAYDYKIDLIDENGTLKTYVTSELIAEVGSDNPDAIEQFRVRKKMRWSPKYVSPLISTPVQRMLVQRQRTGEHRLQFLATAMCVSHAELVCTQLRSSFPELRIDWVGTGEFGRTPEANAAIIDKFCPQAKSSYESPRDPELDGLVHVGMIAEGLDTIFVSEIIQLCPAGFNNRTLQIIGRASRPVLDISTGRSVSAHINFDGSTDLARGLNVNGSLIRAVGSAMIDAMDLTPPPPETTDDKTDDDDDIFPPELPEEPYIKLINLELIGIDSGDEGVQQMARVMEAVSNPLDRFIDFSAIKSDPKNPDWEKVIEAYKIMQAKLAQALDEKSIVAQWKDTVESAVSNIAGVVIGIMRGQNNPSFRVERTLPGDLRRRVNERKKAILGPVQPIPETYKLHYTWCQQLAKELRETRKIPEWLL